MVETAAALGEFLGIYKQRDREIFPRNRPAITSVVAALECATGRVLRPSHGRQWLVLCLAAQYNGAEKDGQSTRRAPKRESLHKSANSNYQVREDAASWMLASNLMVAVMRKPRPVTL